MLKTIREQLEEMSAAEFRALWNHYHRTVYPNDPEKLLTAVVADPVNAVHSDILASMIYSLYREKYQPIATHHGVQVPYKYTQDDAVFECVSNDIKTTWDACGKFCPHYHQCQLIYKLDRINVEYETGGEYE